MCAKIYLEYIFNLCFRFLNAAEEKNNERAEGKEAKVLHKIVFFRFAADAYKCQQQSEKVSFMRTCTEIVASPYQHHSENQHDKNVLLKCIIMNLNLYREISTLYIILYIIFILYLHFIF